MPTYWTWRADIGVPIEDAEEVALRAALAIAANGASERLSRREALQDAVIAADRLTYAAFARAERSSETVYFVDHLYAHVSDAIDRLRAAGVTDVDINTMLRQVAQPT
jgi:predicted metal-dependent phosphotriesterase family hydrolase